MKYSIVITTFNDSVEIIDLLDNISSFKRIPEKIIIADGGSRDNTVEIIKSYHSKIQIKIIQNGYLNIAQGLNLAISECDNKVFMICATGNIYDSEFSEKCLKAIESGADISYGKLKGKIDNNFQKKYSNAFLNGKNGIMPEIPSNHGVVIRKSVIDKYGGFLESLIRAGEDTEYYKYLMTKPIKVIPLDDVSVVWDVPKNIKELYSQIKWYSIASMQLDANVNSLHICLKKIIKILFVFIGLTIFFTINLKFGLFVMACVILLFFFNIKIMKLILQDYVVIKYREYMNSKYLVKRV